MYFPDFINGIIIFGEANVNRVTQIISLKKIKGIDLTFGLHWKFLIKVRYRFFTR